MENRPVKTMKLFIVLPVALAICLLAGFSISWFLDTFCLGAYLPRDIPRLPAYITGVWPSPGSESTTGCYAKSLKENVFSPSPRGIKVWIYTASIFDSLVSDKSHGQFFDRVSLYLDGTQISASKAFGSSDSVPVLPGGNPFEITYHYVFSWAPPLAVGNHTAKLVILTQSEKPIEYEWHFKIK